MVNVTTGGAAQRSMSPHAHDTHDTFFCIQMKLLGFLSGIFRRTRAHAWQLFFFAFYFVSFLSVQVAIFCIAQKVFFCIGE